MLDENVYGTRIYGYSLKSNRKGQKLSRYSHYGGKEMEIRVGYIASTEIVEFGPIKVTVWTMDNGEKYHHY